MARYQPNKDLLRNQVILVTGASRGIGRAVALSYAKHGATVILLARNIEGLEQVYDEMIAEGTPQPAIYPFNLASAGPRDYEELAGQITREFGRLDGLLHNAGALGSLTPIEHYDIRQWYQVIQLILHAPFMLTRALLPALKESSNASIIFTEDDLNQQSAAYWGAYCVAKQGISGFRQLLADELDNYMNVRVNGIIPGVTRTQLRAHAFPAEDSSELPAPETLIQPYLFLMSGDSQHVNGQCLHAQAEPTQHNAWMNFVSPSLQNG